MTTAATGTITPTEPLAPATLLQLLWLASPALPVGGFSYSEGLESAVDAGLVHNEASTAKWLLEQAALVLARSEAPLLVQAHAAWLAHEVHRLQALNTWCASTRESAEQRLQSEQMGRSLLEWLRQAQDTGLAEPRLATLAALLPCPTWPLAYALATALAGAPAREAALAFAFSWAENMTQAAMKAVPLGQAAARRVLAALTATLPGHIDAALALPCEQRQAFAPMLAILSARHESQYSRLFRS